ncbi:hypothetical protein Tsubulata_030024, partial [Turnera subulata]
MKNKRQPDDVAGKVEEEEASSLKRQRVVEEEEEAIDNPLVPYNDVDDDEEDDARRQHRSNGGAVVKTGNSHGGGGENEEEEEYDEEEEDDVYGVVSSNQGNRKSQIEPREDCPYLDTVNRQVLDFDFEKFCSVSLSNLNVYACLVCGKYYQGRGKKSHAYTHSLEAGHHVYINLRTEKVYCLPDGYEIIDPSLDDIRHVLNPRFTRDQVLQLDKNRQWSRALDGSDYLPGMVGLNNIKETDFVNVTIQSLMRVTPLRNFFLIPENYQHSRSPLVQRFGELTRKIWHARNFKGQVSPHEFLQAVMKASKKRFRIGQQSDPVEFMAWLLNTLHAELKSSKKNTSIIYECFQGELEVVKEIPNKSITEKKENDVDEDGEQKTVDGGTENGVVTETSRMPFLMLGLDLPPPPLFKDVMEKNIIPQVPLFNILKKFDGETVTENLELKDYIPLPVPKENDRLRSKYDLIANIVHDGKPKEGFYRVFVQRKSEELWYEMQDLHVSETLPQMVALSEAYVQIYEQQQMKKQLVFIPTPIIGHLVSVIEFAKTLLRRDDRFSITMLLMSPPFAHNVHKFVEILASTHPEIEFIGLPQVTPPAPEDITACPEHYGSIFIADHKPHVKHAIITHVLSKSSVPVAGLVLDMFCTSFVDVGKELNIPSYVFFPSGAAFLGFMFYLPDRNDKVSTKFTATDSPYNVPGYVNPVPYSVLPSVLFHDGGYVSFPDHARRFKDTKGIIVNSFAELESNALSCLASRDGIPPVYTVGPIIDHQGKNLMADGSQHDEIMKWLDDQPEGSVVFLCFGSQGSLSEPQLREIALGLEMSGQRFLWSIRAPPSKGQLNPGEFQDYKDILPDGFLERTKDVGLVCGWAPQVEVLAHKAVGAFVSHCGWNSILESLWHGVPIIAWPLYGEQQINAFLLVRELGLAVELKMDYRKETGDLVEAGEIGKAVRCMMEDGGNHARNKVKAISDLARKALLEGGSSFVATGKLVDILLANKS